MRKSEEEEKRNGGAEGSRTPVLRTYSDQHYMFSPFEVLSVIQIDKKHRYKLTTGQLTVSTLGH